MEKDRSFSLMQHILRIIDEIGGRSKLPPIFIHHNAISALDFQVCAPD